MNLQKLKDLFKDFGKIGGMAGVTTFLPIVGSAILLTVIYQFGPWLQENREIGVLIFVSLMTIFSGLALLATNVLGIVSGFAFDFQIGIAAQIAGIIGASTLMFWLAKRFVAEEFLSTIEEKPKLKAIHNALLNESTWKTLLIITLLRLSPAMPFAVTNFLMSTTGISFKTFLAGTILGMTPRASAVVFVGSSLTELNFSEPQELWILIVGIAATILAVVVVSLFSKRALANLTVEQNA
jgi:uncharacterized membrane protein YdjX (TVP38/TMEM64 family)